MTRILQSSAPLERCNHHQPKINNTLQHTSIFTPTFTPYRPAIHRRSSTRRSVIVQASDRDSKRLVPLILSLPRRVELYFDKYPFRRVLWCLISTGAGFYAGNIVTLSFGALAINDVLAAVITLIFYEVVTRAFYSSKNPSLRLWFANCFKLGVVAAMMADAIKLGS